MFSVCRRGRSGLPVRTAAILAAVSTVAVVLVPGIAAAQDPPAVTVHPGMEIQHTTTEDGKKLVSRCTIGLTGAIGTAQYAVTAGHCHRPGVITDVDGNPVGWYEFHRPDEGLTFGFGLIRLYEGIGIAASMGQYGLSSVDMNPKLGQEICTVGATSGWSCGTITEVNEKWLYASEDLRAEPGDSGAVVYRQTTDGEAAFIGLLVAFDGAQNHAAVIEPADWLFEQIDKHGPTRDHPFIWYRV